MSIKNHIHDGWPEIPNGNDPLSGDDELIVVKAGRRVFRHSLQDVADLSGPQNTIFVTSPDHLVDIDSSKSYMVDGAIDMGTTQIIVPPGGISIAGLNGARDTARLYSSADAFDLFITEPGSHSGNVVIESMTIAVSGAGSRVFALDNDGNGNSIDMANVNFDGCTSLGDLYDYRQMFATSSGFIACDDGWSLHGAWSGVVITDSIAIQWPAATLLKAGTALTISGSIRSNLNFLSVNAAAVFMDFSPSQVTSDEGLLLEGFRTSATNAMPNMPQTSTKARYSNCRGLRNTYVGGQWVVSSSAATVIGAANTKVKAAGSVTYADMVWFSNGGGDNSMTYISSIPVETEVKCVVSLSGNTGDQINVWLRKWDSSASGYVDISSSGAATLNAAGRAEGVALFGYASLDANDRVEVWLENLSAANNVTVLSGGLFGVSER